MTEKRRLITNFMSLMSVQGLNYILPLITLPYLVKVLGPEKFGLINFAQSFMLFFIMFTDYGFNLVSTREISLSFKDKKKVSEIFSTVLFIKVILMLISFLFLTLLLSTIPKFSADRMVYYVSFGVVFGNVLFPIWLFQGFEKMKLISSLNIFAKIISTIGIFIFVKDVDDYLFVPILNSLGAVFIAIIAIYIIVVKMRIRFQIPNKKEIYRQFTEGWDIFLSNIFTSLYTTSNTFFLGLFTNNTIVGYYSGAEKIIKAATGLISPLVQTLYPYVGKISQTSRESTIGFIRKILLVVTFFMGVLCIFIFIYADVLSNIILGEKFSKSIILIKIMAFLPLVLSWANIYGLLSMINFGYKKELSKIYLKCGIVSIVTTLVLVSNFSEIGSAINWILIEFIATMFMVIFLKTKKISLVRAR